MSDYVRLCPVCGTIAAPAGLPCRLGDALCHTPEELAAARISALLRNRNLAQGAGGLFGVRFMFAAQFLNRFLAWLLVIPAALFGWRMWNILELRNAIREPGRSLPARVPSS